MKYFWKDGKRYKHDTRHKANSRKVALDKYESNNVKEFGVKLTYNENKAFKTGFNMGYNEKNKRSNKEKV